MKTKRISSARFATILFASASSLLPAATFTSVATGDWSVPLSWDVGVGFPNTYTTDSAIIDAGTTISYDGSIPTLGGNLAVSGGNSLTVNGGTFTQTWAGPGAIPAFGTTIAIGLSHPASGSGTLNIQAGGTFSSGTANAVAVGASNTTLGSNGGSGVVNIKDGSMIMSTASSGALGGLGLAVGVDGGTGTINVGDGSGAADTAILDLATNNVTLSLGTTTGSGAGTGTVTVSSDGKLTTGTARSFIGESNGGTGTLNVSGGTLEVGAGGLTIARNGAAGTMNVTAGTATIGGPADAPSFVVGDTGSTGNLNVSGGNLNVVNNIVLGNNNGVGVVNQTGGSVTYTGWLSIGLGGGAAGSSYSISGGNLSGAGVEAGSDRQGSFAVSGTANVNVDGIYSGVRSGSSGTVNISGGTTTTKIIGIAGSQQGNATGVMNITGGTNTIVSGGGQSFVGNNAGSTGTLNITGSTAALNNTSGQDFQVGFNGGTGNVNITSGGTMTHNWWVNLARGTGSVGNMTVDGTGSSMTQTAGQTNIGEDGTGTLTISNGGTVSTTDEFSIGRNVGSNGTLTLSDAGSSLNLQNHLWVGRSGNGTLNQTGGAINMNGKRVQIADSPGSTGTVNLTGGTLSNSEWIHVGSGAGATANLNVEYATATDALTTGALYVGNGGANGTTTLQRGKILTTGTLEVGRYGGTGTLNIIGADSEVRAFTGGVDDFVRIGRDGGNGVVNVSNGGKLHTNNSWFTIANSDNTTGNVTVDGAGSQITSHGFIVGWFGSGTTGTLNISNGGTVNNTGREFSIGRDLNGTLATSPTGIVNITSGGTLNAGVDLRVGHNTTGIVNIDGGTLNTQAGWAIVGDGGASNGLINLQSGTLNSADWMVVGNNTGATGQMNISGGTFNVNGGGDAGRFITGRFGNGTVNQTGGAVNVGNWFAVAIDPGSTGVYNFSGGTLSVQSNIDVGNKGTGTMTITHGNLAGTTITGNAAGGKVNAFNVGGDAGGNGTLNIDLQNSTDRIVSRELYAGNGAGTTGVINVTKGTFETQGWVEIGRNGGNGTVNISGAGTVWNRGTNGSDGGGRADVQIGFRGGTGTVNVTDGGTLNHNWWFNLGRTDGNGAANGTLRVSGAGSTINMIAQGDNNVHVNVGEQVGSTGLLEVLDGGKFNHLNSPGVGGGEFFIAKEGATTGTVTVAGSGSELTTHAREFRVGANGTGTLNITDGGVVNFVSIRENGSNADGNFGVGHGAATGVINMDNGTLNVSAWSLFGAWDQTTSTATINMVNSTINVINHNPLNGNGDPTEGGHLFWGDVGQAAINQEGGSINTAAWSAIGRERGGNAVYNLGVGGGGGAYNGASSLYVGRQSHGTINIGTGATLTVASGEFNIGQETSPTTPSSGLVQNDGGTVTTGATFHLGRNGAGTSGTYNQTAGHFVSNLGGNDANFIGRDGTSGTFNITGGDALFLGSVNVGMGGGGSTGTVNIENATMTVNGWFAMGRDTGGATTNTTLNVGAGGVLFHPTGLGGTELLGGWQSGTVANINVVDGGQISYGWWTRFAVDPGSTANVNITGAGSTFDVTDGRTYIGESGVATMNISNGGKFRHLTTQDFFIGGNDGRGSAGSGTVNVSDNGSEFYSAGFMRFGGGNNGGSPATGVLNLTGGTVTSAGWIGFGHEGGVGTLNMEGGTLTTGNELYVGIDVNGHPSATGTANMSGGTINVGTTLIVGRNGGVGTFNKTGGTLTAAGFDLGRNATGSFTNEGGNVQINGSANIGHEAAGLATFNQTGGTINVTANFDVANGGGDATASISNSATLNTQDLYVGTNAGSVGTVDIESATFNLGGWSEIGRYGGTGTVNVHGAGAIFDGSDADMNIGYAGGIGTVNVTDGGQFTHNWWINLGRGGNSSGTMNVDGAGTKVTQGIHGDSNMDNRINVGADPNDGNNVQSGSLSISNGALVERLSTAGEVNVGMNNASVGTVSISGGGRFTNAGGNTHIGRNGGTGTMNVADAGSEYQAGGELFIGLNGTGTLNQVGGIVSAANLRVSTLGGSGVYSLDGGTSSALGDLTVGWQSNSIGSFNLVSGTVNVGVDTYLGVDGTATGTLNMDGGLLNTGRMIIARDAGNAGNLNLNGGTIATNRFEIGLGTASVLFNGGTVKARTNEANFFVGFTATNTTVDAGGLTVDSDTYNIGAQNAFAGSGGITKRGTGSLTLTATSTYTGDTVIDAGSLIVNGSISGSSVTVNAGGALKGSGNTGVLVANDGSTVAPGNSPGILNVLNTTLETGSTFSLELNGLVAGTEHDRLNVTGTVTLNAPTLAISLGFTPVENDKFFVIVNDGADAVSGTFNGLAEGSSFAVGSSIFAITYVADSTLETLTGGNDVALVVIPEPGAVAMLLGGIGMLLGGQRLRRRK